MFNKVETEDSLFGMIKSQEFSFLSYQSEFVPSLFDSSIKNAYQTEYYFSEWFNLAKN